MNDTKTVKYEISTLSVIKILLVLFGAWLIYELKDILIVLLVVMIISIALEPFVLRLEKDKIPRALSVIVLYVALLVILGIFIYFIVPPVAWQIKEITLNFPYYTSKLNELNFGDTSPLTKILDTISTKLSDSAGSIFTGLISVFGGLVYAITIFALTFYSLVEKEGVRKTLVSLIPVSQKDRLLQTVNKVSLKLGDWLRGQLTLMMFIGILDGSVLAILGIKYALTLGIMSGLLEIVPVIGPIISAVVAVIIAFISGVAFWKIVAIVIAYILIQQLENHILLPKIMQKAIGLSPVIIIVAILIGNKLLGLGGAILAVPVAAGIQVFVHEYLPLSKRNS